jgi:hypothetical protein
VYPSASFSAFEIAAPIPRDPPVTIATLLMLLVSSGCRCPVLSGIIWGFEAARGSPALISERSVALDAERHAHAAADAQRREALLGVPALHLEQQRVENTRAGCADG